jgi:SdrD B-like domain
MKRARGRTRRLAPWGCGLWAAAALWAPVHAQAPPPAPPAAAVTPAYQDHYIDNGSLTPDISTGDYGTSDPTGLARAIRIDGVVSDISQQGTNAGPSIHEDGVIVDAQWDTASYGAWSADGAVRNSDSYDHGTASFSLRERAMPFDDGWQSDNSLGDIYSPLVTVARQQPRFIIAQGPMEGFNTEWRGPEGLQFVAGGGEPGLFEGIRVPAFDTLGGSTATAGAQWAPEPQLTLGAEFASAHDTELYYQPLVAGEPGTAGSQRISSDTGLLSAAWQSGPSRVQLNVIDGSLNDYANSLGAWLDAAHTSGNITQSFGAFRIEPDLAWGNQLITSDVEGGYYRFDYQSRRWTADFDVDQVNSVSGASPNMTFVTTDARYQLSRDVGVGGVVNVLYSDGGGSTAWSAQGYFDHVNSWGVGRGQVDYATDGSANDVTVTAQQNWTMPAGESLSTAAAVDRIDSNPLTGVQQQATIVRLSGYGAGDLTGRLSVNGTVQWGKAVEGEASVSTSADVALVYRLNRAWSVLLDYYENSVGSWTQLLVTSPLTPPTATVQPTSGERGFFLTLRYQEARGSHFAPLGGMPGTGSGSLSGVVYLDANANGRYDAGEAGAPNVIVVLDGRFSARTDNNGRYTFPAVAAGHHVLTVETETLPLPWTVTNSGRTEVQVSTRESTEANIGAMRIR